jgi:hypothetical protein
MTRWPCASGPFMRCRKVSPSEKRRRKERAFVKNQNKAILLAYHLVNGELQLRKPSETTVSKTTTTVKTSPSSTCVTRFNQCMQELLEVRSAPHDKHDRCGAKELYEAHQQWCQSSQDVVPLTTKEFYACLQQQFGHLKKNHHGKTIYSGLRLLALKRPTAHSD